MIIFTILCHWTWMNEASSFHQILRSTIQIHPLDGHVALFTEATINVHFKSSVFGTVSQLLQNTLNATSKH